MSIQLEVMNRESHDLAVEIAKLLDYCPSGITGFYSTGGMFNEFELHDGDMTHWIELSMGYLAELEFLAQLGERNV